VLENAAFGLRVRGASARERRAAVMPWLEKTGLASRAAEGITHLSGGERQRVAFVRALAWKPRLMLLDEPFSALDPELRSSLRGELLELHRQWPVPLLLVTHLEEDASELATVRLNLAVDAQAGVRRVLRA
jgi:ABC-type nitrate/sulfonate/bicarbonate transport system ATPase subunit